jgi:hypothetical protein
MGASNSQKYRTSHQQKQLESQITGGSLGMPIEGQGIGVFLLFILHEYIINNKYKEVYFFGKYFRFAMLFPFTLV